METKREHAIERLAGKNAPSIVEAYFEFSHLKSLFRQGWLKHGVTKEQCETVAEHTLGVALLALFLADEAKPGMDKEKILLMGLLHDFGEIYAGDIVPGKMALEDKHALEKESVEKVFGRLRDGKKYLAAWEEFEAGETDEAKYVKEIDRLEMGLQASMYEQSGVGGDLSAFFASTDKALGTPALREIFVGLQRLRGLRGGN